jgi:hypothetical protein
MLFLIGGENSPIESYRVYTPQSFETLEKCIAFYEQDKQAFNIAAQIGAEGRKWQIVCGDQEFKDNLKNREIQPQGKMI